MGHTEGHRNGFERALLEDSVESIWAPAHARR